MLPKLIPYLKKFHLDAMTITADALIVTLSTTRPSARCPVCGRRSRGIPSRYQRTVANMPIAGTPVVLRLHVRTFFCRTRSCVRRIFTERLPDLVAPYGRKSHGLAQALPQIGVALGGEAGARLALALGMATSPDTLLSLMRRAPLLDSGQPRAVGVDE